MSETDREPEAGTVPASVLDIGTPAFEGNLRDRFRPAAALVWLGFIVFPLINAITNGGSPVRKGLTIGGAALFVAAYCVLVLRWRFSLATRWHRGGRWPLAIFWLLVAISAGLTLFDNSGWGFLFTYDAAVAAMVAPVPYGVHYTALCTALAGITSAVGGASGGAVVGFVASCAGIGLLMLLLRDLRLRNDQLTRARAELARLAVAEERERFARDLHDLLGHSLSVITLKAELAGRLLPERPDQAATEVAEIERVARAALGEVREAVSGYRRPTLAGEIAGARMALSAAGIATEVSVPQVSLDPQVEAVLAWAVREGATNVIRHSGAQHCRLRVSATLADSSLELVDDGRGAGNGRRGHGLIGLTERAEMLRGRVEAGPGLDGGFRLLVTLPAPAAGS